MSTYISTDFVSFLDDGEVNEFGIVYFGLPNVDAKTNPKQPFLDPALTLPANATQTLTSGGKFAQRLYLSGPYSVQQRDEDDVLFDEDLFVRDPASLVGQSGSQDGNIISDMNQYLDDLSVPDYPSLIALNVRIGVTVFNGQRCHVSNRFIAGWGTIYNEAGHGVTQVRGDAVALNVDWIWRRDDVVGDYKMDWWDVTPGLLAPSQWLRMQEAIDVMLAKYQRLVGGIGGSFPAVRAKIELGDDVYNSDNELELVGSGGQCCLLRGAATTVIRYVGTQTAVSMRCKEPSLEIISTNGEIRNIHLLKDDGTKPPGSVGLTLERISNSIVHGLSVYGFATGVMIDGGIDCLFNFESRVIESCNIGIIVQQKSRIPGSTIPMKPNLIKIENLFLLNCSSNAIVIRKNPDEVGVSASVGSGSLIELDHINFLSQSSGPALLVDTPGEWPGNGAVKCGTLFFEGHGNTAISIQDGTITIDKLFITGGVNPIVLQDNVSRIVINELDFVSSVATTEGCIIRRADGTTDGIERQVIVRNSRLVGGGATKITANGEVPLTSSYFDLVVSSNIYTAKGTTSLIAGLGSETIYDMGATASCYNVYVRQNDGGIAWRTYSTVFHNGAGTTAVTSVDSANVTVTTSGTNIVLNNTNASAMTLSWQILKTLNG